MRKKSKKDEVDNGRIRHLYIGDNLPILRCLDSESVDLIYLDPPFNSGKQWATPIGGDKGRAKAAFKDTWHPSDTHIDEEYELEFSCPSLIPLIRALHDINGGSWWAYLIYMSARLAEMRRILKPTGSIYYHCDPTMSHGVKLVMDAIFGRENLINEIIWCYTGGTDRGTGFQRKHDVILFYGKTQSPVFNPVHVPFSDMTLKRFNKTDEHGRRYKINTLADGRVTKTFMKEKGKFAPDYWDFPIVNRTYKESAHYPTQKPIALVERIINASSNKGGVVLDPFCGCGTTLVAAQNLKRQWMGVDISDEAVRILRDRMPLFAKSADGLGMKEFIRKLPKRTDIPKMTASEKKEVRTYLYREQKGRCAAPCGKDNQGVEIELRQMHLDHKVAESRGGQNVLSNLQLLCPNCNSTKGADGQTRFYDRILRNAIERKFDEHRRATDERFIERMRKLRKF